MADFVPRRTKIALTSLPPLLSSPAGATAAIDAWAHSPYLAQVIAVFDGEARPPYDRDLAALLAWLEDFSVRWDFRSGQERNLVRVREFNTETTAAVMTAARALGLCGTPDQPSGPYDHVLVLGGLVGACLARPRHAAALLRRQVITTRSVTALGGFRRLSSDEVALAATCGLFGVTDEFDAMNAGVLAAFGVGAPTDRRSSVSDIVGASWRLLEYTSPDQTRIFVVGAPSREPGVRRANTADSYEWFATQIARLRRADRILIVTTDLYLPYQHAEAIRMLAVPYGVQIDAVGMRPGDIDSRLTQVFGPHNYLQEIRSTIRAFRMLHIALAQAKGRRERPTASVGPAAKS